MSEIVGHVAQAEYPDSIYIVRKPESDLLLGDILKIRDRITKREYLVRVYNAYHGLTSISERLASLATKVPKVASTIKSEHFYDVYVASPLCIIEHDAEAVKAFPAKTLPTQLSPVCFPEVHDFGFLKDLEGFDLPLGLLRTRTTGGERNISICLKGEFIPRHIGVYAITGKGKTNVVLILLLSLLKSEGNYSALVFDAHNEYYFGSVKLRGLREVEEKFEGRVKRYDLKEKYAPKISPHNVAPGLLRYIMELSEAQYEACLAYYRKGGENWILNILSETNAIQRGEISVPTITGVRPNTLFALARKLDLVLDGVVVYRQKAENDLVKAVLEDLDKKCVVIINLQDLSDIQEKIVTNILSESLLDERRALQNRDPSELGRKPIVLVVLEEALSVLSQSILRKGDNVFAHIVREGRKFRVGLLPVVQIPRRLDEDVASQINTNIILGTAQQADRAFIAESAQQDLATLTNEMKMLDVGEALVSFPAEVPFPLPVKIFHFNEYAEKISETSSITPARKEVKTSKTEVDVAPPSL
jgi:hypothetical protein